MAGSYTISNNPWYSAPVAPKAPVASAVAPVSVPKPAADPYSAAKAQAANQARSDAEAAAKRKTAPAPMSASITPSGNTYVPPPQGGSLGGLQQAAAPGNTNITQVDGSNLGREMDTIEGGVGGPLRRDLGTRTPPSLAALLQGLKY